jgi:choline dehydrogenase-like flavoprotein
MSALDTDVLVVGSGFGGSVTALRLAEKGYDVLVVESGRRFADADMAATSWDLRRYLWAPRLAASASSGSTSCPTSCCSRAPGWAAAR